MTKVVAPNSCILNRIFLTEGFQGTQFMPAVVYSRQVVAAIYLTIIY